jgi:Arc/MetJ family transcription regulator
MDEPFGGIEHAHRYIDGRRACWRILREHSPRSTSGNLRYLEQISAISWLLDGGAVMAMVKTPVEIDEEALATAAEVLGTKTKKDTVNAALREVGQRLERLRALAQLGEMADRGDFDEFLGNKAAYRR